MLEGPTTEQFQVLGKAFRARQSELNVSIARIAQRTALDRRTIQQALAGQKVREATLRELSSFFELDLESALDGYLGPEIASLELGGYARHNVSQFEGKFYSYRPNFRRSELLVRTIFEIQWDKSNSCLTFEELHQYKNEDGSNVDNSQSGVVYRSPHTGLLHFQTAYRGSVRLITVRPVSSQTIDFAGVVLTQFDDTFSFRPAVAPMVLVRNSGEQELPSGMLERDNNRYSEIVTALRDVADRFVVSQAL